MTDRPIIFSAPMVRALIEGRKTQTRRVLSPALTTVDGSPASWRWSDLDFNHADVLLYTSFGSPTLKVPFPAEETRHRVRSKIVIDDRLWVRESLKYDWVSKQWQYAADGIKCAMQLQTPTPERWPLGSAPSIHMPRAASRLTLHVTDVRIQRLQDISKADVISEGVTERDGLPIGDVVAGWHEPFAQLWDILHGDGAWSANPWIIALTFSVEHANIDQARKAA